MKAESTTVSTSELPATAQVAEGCYRAILAFCAEVRLDASSARIRWGTHAEELLGHWAVGAVLCFQDEGLIGESTARGVLALVLQESFQFSVTEAWSRAAESLSPESMAGDATLSYAVGSGYLAFQQWKGACPENWRPSFPSACVEYLARRGEPAVDVQRDEVGAGGLLRAVAILFARLNRALAPR